MSGVIKLHIDDQTLEAESGSTILEACRKHNIPIPTLCYHAHLSKAGNCRMCLVEIAGNARLVTSCTEPIREGLTIYTNSPRVQAARAGNLGFLLANHPLDCPLCDKGGECALQELSFIHGYSQSCFDLEKRTLPQKNLSPLISTDMTRCIHCTRCIRFLQEVTGTCELGGLNSGENLEIATYREQGITSELSGNLVDICPVGALNSKPFASRARPWELQSFPSIDILDAVGSHIQIDCREQEVVRIIPRVCDAINESWISDKARYACDGLKHQRLEKPYLRKEGILHEVTWDEAFQAIKLRFDGLSGPEIAAIAGDLCDCEAMIVLKDLLQSLGSPYFECRQDGSILDINLPYLFNTTLAGIDHADACLLIATNPRHEAVMVNTRLYKRFSTKGLKVGLIGPAVDLQYAYMHLGETASALKDIALGKHPFADILAEAETPLFILGQAALSRPDSHEILRLAQHIAQKTGVIRPNWNGFNVLHTAASRVGGLELGFTSSSVEDILQKTQNKAIKAVYLLGADEIPMERLENAFVIYQGHHYDKGARYADVLLPGAAYTEKSATYVNMERRSQRTVQALLPPGLAKEDWRIIRKLSDVLGHTLPYNTLEEVHQRLINASSIFSHREEIVPVPWKGSPKESQGSLSPEPFSLPIPNFYLSDPISRHSPTMALCHKAQRHE